MAIGPINYIQNVQNPFEGMNQAFANFANMRAQNEQRQYQNNLLAMKQAAAEAKAEAAARQQEDIENFINSIQNKTATARDYAIMMARYPQASEGVKRSWETLDKNQKEGQFKQMLAMDQAAHNDPVELEKMFTNTIDAAANSGNQEMASDYQEKLDLIQGKIPGVDKEKGLAIIKAKLRTGTFAIDPEYAKVVTAMEDERRKEEKQPLEVSKLQSEAMKQAVDAEYAARMAKEEFEKIKLNQWATKQERAVAWKNAATAESNSRAMWASLGMRADEMKNIKGPIASIQRERQKEQTEKVKQGQVLNFTSEVQAADSMLRAGAELYNHPGLSSTVGTRQGRGAVSWVKGVLYQDVEDVKGAIDDLSSNTFLSKSPFLKGTQTKQDRDDIVSSYGSLKTTMSEKSIRTAIKAGIEASHRARMNLSRAYKMAPPPLNEKYLKLLSTKSQEEEKEAAKIKSREEMPLPEMPSENEALPTMKNMMGY